MNATLYRSCHAVAALVLAAGFALWAWALGTPRGFAVGVDRPFLLYSGFVALALYLVLWAYAARKAAHRTRWSFEFARTVPIEQIERAQARLSDLRAEVLAGRATASKPLRARAARILQDEAVDKVVAVAVVRGPQGRPQIELRWKEPLGRLAKWMHAHLYYGLAAALLVTLHGGLRFASPMGILLDGLSLAVIGTGIAGIALWTFGPAWLSRAEGDLNYERAAALRAHYARKVAAAARALTSADGEGRAAAPAQVDGARGGNITAEQSLLAWGAQEPEATRIAVRDFVTLLGQQRAVESVWQRLSSRRFVLNVWRLVHVPLSIALVLVVCVHVVSVWVY